MSEQNVTKRELEEQNILLQEDNDALLKEKESFASRIAALESMVAEKKAAGNYDGLKPELYHDPFDVGINPHHIKKHPDGLHLDWKNPNIRNGATGWRGWEPVTYDSEIGKNLQEYIPDPPVKMAGSAHQDNYVRRGTDSILCTLPEEIWKARQMKRESKALRAQVAASAQRNTTVQHGVETFGDGVQQEYSPAGGFKSRGNTASPSETFHRTEMFTNKE